MNKMSNDVSPIIVGSSSSGGADGIYGDLFQTNDEVVIKIENAYSEESEIATVTPASATAKDPLSLTTTTTTAEEDEKNSKILMKSIKSYLDTIGSLFSPIESNIKELVWHGMIGYDDGYARLNSIQQALLLKQLNSAQGQLKSIGGQLVGFVPAKIQALKAVNKRCFSSGNLLGDYVQLQKSILEFQNKIGAVNYQVTRFIQKYNDDTAPTVKAKAKTPYSRPAAGAATVTPPTVPTMVGSMQNYITNVLFKATENLQMEILKLGQED